MDDEFYDSFESTDESEGEAHDVDRNEGLPKAQPHSYHDSTHLDKLHFPVLDESLFRAHSQSTPVDPFQTSSL